MDSCDTCGQTLKHGECPAGCTDDALDGVIIRTADESVDETALSQMPTILEDALGDPIIVDPASEPDWP